MLCACVPSDISQAPPVGPGQVSASGKVGETEAEEWMIPSSARSGFRMRALVFRPAGNGPFPMAVINHGSDQDAGRRKRSRLPEFASLTSWFVRHRYVVVLPERPGHGGGGPYLEDQNGCEHADYVKAAEGAADSIADAVDYMKQQSFVSPEGIVVAGHSAGALGSLAYAARKPPGVRAVVNFSGGRGGHHMNKPDNNCAPDRLVAAVGLFGQTTRVPTLWIYAENDTYFPPALSQAMVAAFRSGGGRADYELLPPLSGEGHFAIRSSEWSDILEKFLAAPQ